MTKFNAIIIGSGQAGNPLSEDMADAGWKVAMIERMELVAGSRRGLILFIPSAGDTRPCYLRLGAWRDH
jgi:choline dehydrogenase-like flavoprotein